MIRVKIEPESDEESSSSPPPHQAGRMELAVSQYSTRSESKPVGNRFDTQAASTSDETESYCASSEEEYLISSDDDESWLSPTESSPDDEIVNFKNEIEKIIHHHYRKPGFKTFLKVKWKGYRITTWESLDYIHRYRDDSELKKYVRGLSEVSKRTLLRRAPFIVKYLRTKKSSRRGNNSRSNE